MYKSLLGTIPERRLRKSLFVSDLRRRQPPR